MDDPLSRYIDSRIEALNKKLADQIADPNRPVKVTILTGEDTKREDLAYAAGAKAERRRISERLVLIAARWRGLEVENLGQMWQRDTAAAELEQLAAKIRDGEI